MVVKELIEYLSKASPEEAFTFILTINAKESDEPLIDTKSKLVSWATENKIRVNALPGFPQLIVQTSVENWTGILELPETQSLLIPKSVNIELNEDVGFAPHINITEY